MVYKFDYSTGTTVEDAATNRSGVISGLIIRNNGNKQYFVYDSEAKSFDDGFAIDEAQLFPAKEQPHSRLSKVSEFTCPINLGDKVIDKSCGIKGRVMSIIYWVNGCVRIEIQPKAKKFSLKKPSTFMTDMIDCKKVKDESIKRSKKRKGTGGLLKK